MSNVCDFLIGYFPQSLFADWLVSGRVVGRLVTFPCYCLLIGCAPPVQWVREEAPDVICLQETKCAEKSLPSEITSMPEFPHKYWAGSDEKEGYSGVAMLCKTEPLSVTYGIGKPRPPASAGRTPSDGKVRFRYGKSLSCPSLVRLS